MSNRQRGERDGRHTLQADVVNTSASFLGLDVALETTTVGVVLVVLLAVLDGIGDERSANDVVACLGLRDVEAVEDGVDLVSLELRVNSVLEKRVAGGRLERRDAVVRVTRDLDVVHALGIDDFVDESAPLRGEVVEARNVDLVNNEDGGLVGEEGLNGVEELTLRFDRVSALLGKIHEVENARLEMSESGDALHLDVVHLFERMVEDTGGVNDLPSHVAIVQMTDEEGLCREGVGLNVDVRAGDFVEEGRLAHVRVAADQESAGGGVDRGETGDVFADLLEELEGFVLPLHDSGHTTESSTLELLASVETVTELEEADIVFCNLVDKVPSGAELPEGELVVVLVVENIEERGEEGVEVLRKITLRNRTS